MSDTIPQARKNNLVIQELGKELLVYDLTVNKVFNLNETSALVWQLSDGSKTVTKIAEIIFRKLNTPFSMEIVWLALAQLKIEKLLEQEVEISASYEGLNRREVIRKIGFGSLVTLPVIASVIAPTSALAASNCGTAPNIAPGCSCVVNGLPNSGNCASQCCGFANGSTSGICVPRGTVATGNSCLRDCQCATGCCSGIGVCAATNKPSGAPCTTNCECASLLCGSTDTCV